MSIETQYINAIMILQDLIIILVFLVIVVIFTTDLGALFYWQYHCLFKGVFRLEILKASRLRITDICVGDPPLTQRVGDVGRAKMATVSQTTL